MNALKLLFKKSSKAESFAKIFHAEGNQYFKQKKYFDALHSYNKSLCHAKRNSADLVNAFAGRSAVYFEMKRYADSLENIGHARAQSESAVETNLDEFESCCKEFLKDKNTNDAEDRLSLSYPSHAQIPFLANCLELGENDKFGRYIKTNRDLRPGDVIAIEEPLLKFIGVRAKHYYKYQRCFNCFKSNHLNLLPGPHSVMSCSQACHDLSVEKNSEFDELIETELDWKVVKMIRINDDSLAIAGSVEKLKDLYYGRTKTLFDFDFNRLFENELKNALLKCSISLIGGTSGDDSKLDVFELMVGSYHERYRDFLVQYVGHMMSVCRKTQFSFNVFDELIDGFEKIGNCLLPFGGLLNHSCDPNIFWVSANEKFVFTVAKPVSAGEQLFICYRKTFLEEPLAKRQKALLKQYGFKCDCSACRHNYPTKTSIVDDRLQIEHFRDDNAQSIRAEVMKNWSEIQNNFDKHTPHETAEIIGKNKFLLEIIGSKFM